MENTGKFTSNIVAERVESASHVGSNELDLSGLKFSDQSLSKVLQEFNLPSQITILRLNNNELTKIPSVIGRFSNVMSLNLASNKLQDIGELCQLNKVRYLNLSGNQLDYLPSQIGNLTELSHLDLSDNYLSDLPPEIKNLQQLHTLLLHNLRLEEFYGSDSHAGNNHIVNLPDEIRFLTNLTELNLGNNSISKFPIIITKLKNLHVLYLWKNSISELPKEIKNLENLEKLHIHTNPLPIPPEILEEAENPSAIINYFFSLKEKQSRSLNETKTVFVGQGNVGKTSLVMQLILNTFNPKELKTIGISINTWQVVNNREAGTNLPEIKVNIWDFGGQEIMHATHQFFLTKRSLYLLVLDSRLTQEENRVEYWLKIIQSFGGGSPVLIVGNKIDQHPLDIDRTGLQKKYPKIVGILETSAATGAGIEELKAAITEQVNNLPHVRDLLPETWFTVKTKLEELGKQSNFINHDDYVKLCAENEVSDETSQRKLIGFLHDLGVVLHFQDDPRLEALGILNPQWVTNGVYKILNSHALFQNKGVLTVSMLDEILNLPEYPRGKRLFIVDMMKKFELCYDIEPDKTFLVPDLLPKDQPDLNFNGIPAFEYAYPVLPSSVITRFIVRMNQHICDGCVWRTGVVLKIGDNKSLVKADIEDRKITIAIGGLEHTRRGTLSAILFQLDEIHASIKGLDAQKRVPVPNAPKAEPLKYEYLLKLERAGQETLLVENGNDLVTVNVRQMLSGVVSEAERRQSAGNTTNIYIGGSVSGTIIAGDDNEVQR